MWALVPIKDLSQSKSRLADLLDPIARRDLQLALLADLLDVLNDLPAVQQTLVISSDEKVETIARSMGAMILADPETLSVAPEAGLNAALRSGSDFALRAGAKVTLLLPGDLPCVQREDVQELSRLLEAHHSVVVVPDRHGEGTNALLCRPPNAIEFKFGRGSCKQHLEAARDAGLNPRLHHSRALGLDLDTPDDVATLRASGKTSARVARVLDRQPGADQGKRRSSHSASNFDDLRVDPRDEQSPTRESTPGETA